MATYDIPRGTRDLLPPDMAVRNHVERKLRAAFESCGFQQVQTPTFERFSLLAARSGEEIRESMLTFVSDREEYALRPELTAAVCRLVASGALESRQLPLPYKLYYIGECFRYCRPQAGRYREFTQAGVELVGSKDPLADAEVIALAVKSLRDLGITDYKLKIGNIGIFRAVLAAARGGDAASPGGELGDRIIGNLDAIASVREKCEAISARLAADERGGGLTQDDRDFVRVESDALYRLQEEIEYDGEREIFPERKLSDERIRERLEELPLVAEDTYRAKWAREGTVPAATAELLLRVSATRGKMEEVMPRAEELLAGTGAGAALEELRLVCGLLPSLGVDEFEVVLGVARGLDFYTGTVFEADSPLLGAQKQICGGGRYDRLVSEFGGPDVPAMGFAFGFDRVVEVFTRSGKSVDSSPVDVFVATTDATLKAEGARLATALRDAGLRAGVDLLGLDLRGQLGHAAKLGARFAAILGPEELREGNCKLRDLGTREERTVPLTSVAAAIGK